MNPWVILTAARATSGSGPFTGGDIIRPLYPYVSEPGTNSGPMSYALNVKR